MGQKAKILLHGRLKLRDKLFNISKLKNTKVKVNLQNSQDIKSLFSFTFDEWSESGDKEIEIPIQSYTKHINIEVSANVVLQSGKEVTLTDSKEINFILG